MALLRQEHFVKWSARPLSNIRLSWRDHRSSSPRAKLSWSETATLPLPRSIRPETYIQFGGRAILEQLTRKLPSLMTLPSRIPASAMEALCWRPFCQILDHVCWPCVSDVVVRRLRLQALECVARGQAQLASFYPFIRMQSAIRRFKPLRKIQQNGVIRSRTGTVAKKSVFGMVDDDLLRVVCR